MKKSFLLLTGVSLSILMLMGACQSKQKADILLMDSLQQKEALKIRIYAMMDPVKADFDYFFPKGPLHTGRLTVSVVKLYIDGALGSRGALLL